MSRRRLINRIKLRQAEPPSAETPSLITTAPSLELERITIRYGQITAIQDASLRVERGDIMALVGPSGCGKSSLLNSINRLTSLIPGCQVSGRILLDGADSAALDDTILRRTVGMVFQRPNPFPLSISDNIRFPLREHGIRNRHELNSRIAQVLQDVGLWDEVKDRLDASALTLSGGQQQRLCIARALALQPSVLLFDEPCSALDPIASSVVENLITRLKGRYTVLMVTHNLAQARRVADTVAVCWMNSGCGCVIETGPTRLLFEAAKHPVAAAYFNGESG